MTYSKLKNIWLEHYASSSEQLEKMANVNGLISAFNANIDAVIKLSGNIIQSLIDKVGFSKLLLESDKHIIDSKEDVIRGLIHCFTKGIAEEWLIENVDTFKWIRDEIGHDKMQMGGQGGIVANVTAVCGVNPVYVHCASLPSDQAELFQDLDNLLSVDNKGEIKKAFDIHREDDIPLIHYILEFDKGDNITIDDETYTCPKSNRFIATYDPLNFQLYIDKNFIQRLQKNDIQFDYIILSGYQMLQEQVSTSILGKERVDESLKVIEVLKTKNKDCIVHFEVASTQDKVIRKYLIDKIACRVESIGFNERELIDILEIINEIELAEKCDVETNSVNLFQGMFKVYEYTKCPRLQLHMFGLYITLQNKGFKVTPDQNRKGMQLAASVAASKAGTGSIDTFESLQWAFGKEVSDIGLKELESLKSYLSSKFGTNSIIETGVFENDEVSVIAVPTILIEKPVTLVGMGDTISSVSLVAAQ
jgi:ADP-dependent phosphofructokinase/glucokinase